MSESNPQERPETAEEAVETAVGEEAPVEVAEAAPETEQAEDASAIEADAEAAPEPEEAKAEESSEPQAAEKPEAEQETSEEAAAEQASEPEAVEETSETPSSEESPADTETAEPTEEAAEPGEGEQASEEDPAAEPEPVVIPSDDERLALLEAIIYVTEEPLTAELICGGLALPREIVEADLTRLIEQYKAADRGVEVRKVAGGYKMYTKAEHHEAVRGFVRTLQPKLKLSKPAFETLAVIAYKQPITVPEIQAIRGVNASGTIHTLLKHKLITSAGRKKVIGKPMMYKTTREFLVQFGLDDLGELPNLKEFEELSRAALGDEPAEEALEEGSDEAAPAGEALEPEAELQAIQEAAAEKDEEIEAPETEAAASEEEPAERRED